MIAVQNIIDNDKSLFTLVFDKDVMDHLKCKCDNYLIVFQSNFKPNYFMVIKSDTGYRIRRYPNIKQIYQININYKFNDISEFDLKECDYFMKKNNSVRIILNMSEE